MCRFSSARHLSMFHWTKSTVPASSPCPKQIGDSSLNLHDGFSPAHLVFFSLGVCDGLLLTFLDAYLIFSSDIFLHKHLSLYLFYFQAHCFEFQVLMLWRLRWRFVCPSSKCWTQITGNSQHLLPCFELNYPLGGVLCSFPLFPLFLSVSQFLSISFNCKLICINRLVQVFYF